MVFYSRADENYFSGSRRYISTGNTEKVANMIAAATGADLFKVEQKVPYAADYDTCIAQAKRDLQAKARPELVSMPESLQGSNGNGRPCDSGRFGGLRQAGC